MQLSKKDLDMLSWMVELMAERIGAEAGYTKQARDLLARMEAEGLCSSIELELEPCDYDVKLAVTGFVDLGIVNCATPHDALNLVYQKEMIPEKLENMRIRNLAIDKVMVSRNGDHVESEDY